MPFSPPRSLKGLLFDKDGTLLDFHATWMPLCEALALRLADGDPYLAQRLLEAGGYDSAARRIRAGTLLAAGSTGELAAAWLPHLPYRGGAELTEELDRVFAEEGVAGSVPVTELAPLFQRLKGRGLKLGVATSDNERAAKAILERLGVLPLLDFVCGYDTGHGIKPHPGMIEAFCRTTGLEPGEIAMIGDNLHDIEMGRSAGVALTVGVLTGTSEEQDLAAHADLVLRSIAELEEWLAEGAGV